MRDGRRPITPTMNPAQTVILMAEGDFRAKKILTVMAEADPSFLLHIDDMNMRGVQVVEALKFCNGEFDRFRISIATRHKEMVDWVNKRVPMWTAITRGGAPR